MQSENLCGEKNFLLWKFVIKTHENFTYLYRIMQSENLIFRGFNKL